VLFFFDQGVESAATTVLVHEKSFGRSLFEAPFSLTRLFLEKRVVLEQPSCSGYSQLFHITRTLFLPDRKSWITVSPCEFFVMFPFLAVSNSGNRRRRLPTISRLPRDADEIGRFAHGIQHGICNGLHAICNLQYTSYNRCH
jgi:hypothetical protein